jgi:spore germination cell wall hydrolase CwlJ-like protein
MRASRVAVALACSVVVATAAHAAALPPEAAFAASLPEQVQSLEPAQPAAGIVIPAEPPAAPVSLSELVSSFDDSGTLDQDSMCLAKAVYFEARGEPLDGQLAVAKVVLNRANSGIFPSDICEVVTQRKQFSFVRGGQLPPVDETTATWHTAVAIAHIARSDLAPSLPANVLWYHASYVSPPWDRWHTQAARIGAHIFYS